MEFSIVKNTMYISFIIQIVTLVIGVSAQFIKLKPHQLILKQALFLENFVQLIEGTFYFWFIYFYTKNVDKIDIAKYRYYDWFLTTPTMILSTIAFFYYNNNNLTKKHIDIISFFKNDFFKIIELFFYNFNMLIFGFLQEINVIKIIISTFFGFVFFALLFYKMFIYYVNNNLYNIIIFYSMFIIWALYGIAAIFNSRLKNASYNILDTFSKNFYGLFLSFIVYKLSISN